MFHLIQEHTRRAVVDTVLCCPGLPLRLKDLAASCQTSPELCLAEKSQLTQGHGPHLVSGQSGALRGWSAWNNSAGLSQLQSSAGNTSQFGFCLCPSLLPSLPPQALSPEACHNNLPTRSTIRRNRGSERLSNFPQVTQPLRDRSGLRPNLV